MIKKINFRVVLFLIIPLTANPAWSGQYELGANTSIATSDNVTQTLNGPDGNTVEAGFIFNLDSEEIPNWELSFDSSFQQLNYSVSDLATEYRKSILGQSIWTPDSSNFGLTLYGNLSQVPESRFQTEEVINLIDSEIYAIAPSYFFRISPVTRLSTNYQHVEYKIEQRQFSRDLQSEPRHEQQLTLSLERTLNSTNSISLVVQKRDTDFEDDSFVDISDYIQESIFARWNINNRANQLNLELGKYRVKDLSEREISEYQWTLLYNRRINRNQSVNLQFFRRVSSLFIIDQITGEIIVDQQIDAINQAEESQGTGVLYNFDDGNLSLNIAYFNNKLKGLFDESSDTRESFSTFIRYDLSSMYQSPLSRNIAFFVSNVKNTFDLGITDLASSNIKQASISYEHFISPRLSLSFSYIDRDVDQTFLTTPDQTIKSETFRITFDYLLEGRF